MSEIYALLPGVGRQTFKVPAEYQEDAKQLDAGGNQRDNVLSILDATGDKQNDALLGKILNATRDAVFENADASTILTDARQVELAQKRTQVRGRVLAAVDAVFPQAVASKVSEIGWAADDSHAKDLAGMDVRVAIRSKDARHSTSRVLYIGDEDSSETIQLKLRLAYGQHPEAYTQWLKGLEGLDLGAPRSHLQYVALAVMKTGVRVLPVRDRGRRKDERGLSELPQNRFVNNVAYDQKAGALTITQPHGHEAGTTVIRAAEIFDRFSGKPTGEFVLLAEWVSADGSESGWAELRRDNEWPLKWTSDWKSMQQE